MQAKMEDNPAMLSTPKVKGSFRIKHMVSESTGPDQRSVKDSLSPSTQGIRTQISSRKAFLSLGKPTIEEQMNEVFFLHQNPTRDKTHQKSKTQPQSSGYLASISSPTQSSVADLQKKCQQIIARRSRYPNHKKTVNRESLLRSKTTQEIYDEAQKELASQLIAEASREKNQFEATMGKFKRLIGKATEEYVANKDINFNPRKARRLGLRTFMEKGQVCNRYEDEVFQFQKYLDNYRNNMQTNKQDVYMFLSSANKVINIEKLNEELAKQGQKLKIKQMMAATHQQRSLDKKNSLIYHRYFRNSKERRQILQYSLKCTYSDE